MNKNKDVEGASVQSIVMRLTDLVEYPFPITGPVKIKREAILANFSGCKIVQSGSVFRLHGFDFSVSVEPLDALWIIQTLSLGASLSPLMRRVVAWQE